MIVRVPCGGFRGLIRGFHRAAAAESSRRMPGRPATVLAGQRPGIKEVDDGIWIVSFMRDDKLMCPERTTRKWCRKRDSNPRPPHYECGALPTELLRREMRVPDTGRRPDWQARGTTEIRRTPSPESAFALRATADRRGGRKKIAYLNNPRRRDHPSGVVGG